MRGIGGVSMVGCLDVGVVRIFEALRAFLVFGGAGCIAGIWKVFGDVWEIVVMGCPGRFWRSWEYWGQCWAEPFWDRQRSASRWELGRVRKEFEALARSG